MMLHEWAARWGIPDAALRELAGIPAVTPVPPGEPGNSESHVQARVRLEAARTGEIHAFRNNNGAGSVVNPRELCLKCAKLAARPIRWGLGNDSPRLNEILKSGDLIGWRRRIITPAMLGRTIAQFWSRECKHSTWKFTNVPHEAAQLRWHSMVLAAGGDSAIVTGEGSCAYQND